MRVEVCVPISYEVRRVWQWAGGFNLLPAISMGCVTSALEDGGRVRVLTNTDGSILWERLLSYDENRHFLSYLIEDSKGFSAPYDIGYVGTVEIVKESKNSSIFKYSGEFIPVRGATEDDGKAAIERFAHDCAAGIERVISRS